MARKGRARNQFYDADHHAAQRAANRGKNTNGSQFFIMDKDYPLPPNYTIFGHVTSGQAAVSSIANTPRDPNDMPKTPVKFTVEVKN